MSQNTKVCLVAVGAWLVWTSIAYGDHHETNHLCLPTQTDGCTSSVAGANNVAKNNYTTVSFTTVGVTRKSFREFINVMRDLLASGPRVHGILRLREGSAVPFEERYILVILSNCADTPITLAIDVTDVSLAGYKAGDKSYYFPDVTLTSNVFPDTTPSTLLLNRSYTALEYEAGKHRTDISLGVSALERAIVDLHDSDRRVTAARSFLVVIQMISETIRFRYIENLVVKHIGIDGTHDPFVPTATMIALENNWETLSTRIQQSVQGRFSPAVALVDLYGNNVSVCSVTPGLVLDIAIIKFVCNTPYQLSQHPNSNILINEHPCSCIPEPTLRISGRNGLCADVKDGIFNNGDPIILYPCKSNQDANQLWTLKTDGTIRSNGKCMTAYGSAAGQYVMIYDCKTAATDATKWQIWDNGTIINPKSGLVLSAESGKSLTVLTLENNIYASRQGWLASNKTEPIVTPIVSDKDRCMESNFNQNTSMSVGIKDCASNNKAQEWAIFPDGSIRQNGKSNNCLAARGIDVVIDLCDGGAGQRWLFKNDGSIMNMDTGFVLTVIGTNKILEKIIVFPFIGVANQIWYAWLL